MGNRIIRYNINSDADGNVPTMQRCYLGHENLSELKPAETYQSLLSKLDSAPCQNSEFIELNKIRMVECGPLDDQDYMYFWGCMKLYEEYDVNYFAYYLDLLSGFFGDFSNGVDEWINDRYFRHDEDMLREFVCILRFFGIENYDGISFQELNDVLEKYKIHARKAQEKRSEEYKIKAAKTIQKRIDDYFNFSDFDGASFKNYLDEFTVKRVHKEVLLDEALIEAKTAPENTYIVILYKNGKACYVGKTEHLMKYIGDKSQKYDADSVFYHVADPEYVDDLIIAIMIYYDLSLSSVRPKKVHRKYATVQQACNVYWHADNVRRKKVLSAIESNYIRTYEINEDKKLIDKTELERVIRSSLGRQ